MCTKILEAAGKLNMDEFNFFLRGGVVSVANVNTIIVRKYIQPVGEGGGQVCTVKVKRVVARELCMPGL